MGASAPAPAGRQCAYQPLQGEDHDEHQQPLPSIEPHADASATGLVDKVASGLLSLPGCALGERA